MIARVALIAGIACGVPNARSVAGAVIATIARIACGVLTAQIAALAPIAKIALGVAGDARVRGALIAD